MVEEGHFLVRLKDEVFERLIKKNDLTKLALFVDIFKSKSIINVCFFISVRKD